jgi:hypothetical protein
MLGKAGLFWMVFSLTSVSFGANGPDPFTSFFEFLTALEEMPVEEFVKSADQTPSGRMSDYHRTLEGMDPRNFERWNQKLRLVHSPGFAKAGHYWELHARGPEMTIGFHPQAKDAGFESIADFFASVKNDTPEQFQVRVRLSSQEDLNRWLEIMSVRSPEWFETALVKFALVPVIGFQRNPIYRLPQEPEGPARPIGYGRSEEPLEQVVPIKTVDELIAAYESSTPEEFLSRLQALSQKKASRLLGAVKKTNPELYLAMLKKTQSRTRIGYTSSAEPEIIPPGENPQGERKPVGFKQASRPCSDFLKPE